MALSNPLIEFARGAGDAAWEYAPAERRLLWSEGPLDDWFGAGATAPGAGPRQWLGQVVAEDRARAAAALRGGIRRPQDQLLKLARGEQAPRTLRLRLAPTGTGTVLGWCEKSAPESAPESAEQARLRTVGEMTTRIAHDLNQPLAAILNYLQGSLQRLPSGGEWKSVRTALESASAQASRVGSSVRSLRSFVAHQTPAHSEVDLGHLIASSVDLIRLQPAARGHTIEFHNELPQATVWADPGLVQQVLLALLQNAVEACTRRPGVIRLWAGSARDDPSRAEIEIRDNGVGIQESEFDRLFAAFESTKPGSLGLGLTISRSLLQAHRSELRCERRAPGITAFSFRLAFASPSPPS